MKALAVLALSLVATTPAAALGRGGGHPGGFHPGGFGHHGGRGPGIGHERHEHHGPGLWLGAFSPEIFPVSPEPAAVAPAEPIAASPPVPVCPTAAPPSTPRRVGPHIIYIDHKPDIHGPRVIYGTE